MNSTNTSNAVKMLKKLLSMDTQWHNEETFPVNESNALAFKTCVDVESAKKFCPVRYAALKKWIAACREIMSLIHPQFVDAFHVTGINKLTLLTVGNTTGSNQDLRHLHSIHATNCGMVS
jgi:hypothetical protein